MSAMTTSNSIRVSRRREPGLHHGVHVALRCICYRHIHNNAAIASAVRLLLKTIEARLSLSTASKPRNSKPHIKIQITDRNRFLQITD